MSSTSETGYAKTVANFKDLISFCIGYEGKYLPSRKALEVPNLQTLHQTAVMSLLDVKVFKTTYDKMVNQRQIVYAPIKKLGTRVVNALISSGANTNIIADARTINRKLQGVRAPKATPPPPQDTEAPEPTTKTISASQQSFDSLYDHFQKLHQLVTQEEEYKPNETDLQLATLTGFLNELETSNTNVINAITTWSNKRIARDTILYAEPDGLVPIALAVKVYIKSVFTASGPQYKQVSKIAFSRQGK